MPENKGDAPNKPEESPNPNRMEGLGEELRKRFGPPPKAAKPFMTEEAWKLVESHREKIRKETDETPEGGDT